MPFRCLAAEVFTRQQVIQKAGSLADAVRNSMSFPLAFRPILGPDGRYLFDGGLYNNFPTDVMHREFAPDVVIGVNVGDGAYQQYPFKNADQLLPGALLFLGTNQADTLRRGANDLLLEPDLTGSGGASAAAPTPPRWGSAAGGSGPPPRRCALPRCARRVCPPGRPPTCSGFSGG